MIEFKIKGCSVDIHTTPTTKERSPKGLHIVKCEYSGTVVLMQGHQPLMTVTSADLSALYEMLKCDSSDTMVSDMIRIVSDYIDSH